MMKTNHLLLLAIIMLSACLQNEPINVDQDHIHTDYELLYDANRDETTVKVQFRYANTTGSFLRISEPASVAFNGINLTYSDSESAYVLIMQGKTDHGTFVFTDADQRQYTNTIDLGSFIELPEIRELSRTEDLEINWLGDPVGENEEIKLLASANTENIDLASQATPNSLNLLLSCQLIADLSHSQIDLMIDRIYAIPLQNATSAGGKLTSKYRASKFNVQLN